MKTYENIKFEISNGIATITLDRPDAANSINIPLAKDLLSAALVCEGNESVRAVILTGAGRMFCGGGDINSFEESFDNIGEMLTELTGYLHLAITRLRHMRAPVIVAVNGTAAGAGLSLAMIGDYVVASEKAKFTMAYTGIGLSPDGSATHFLPRIIGLRKAQELMITNRLLSAREALDWGLVNKLAAPEDTLAEARSLAEDLAKGPTNAFGSIKELLNQSYLNGLETQMDLESRHIAKLGCSDDGREGITAFLEQRAPQYKGGMG